MKVFLSLESIPDSLFRSDDVKQVLVGLMRDLRGIAMATSSRRTYGFLFDWLYPARMPLILKATTVWADVSEGSQQIDSCVWIKNSVSSQSGGYVSVQVQGDVDFSNYSRKRYEQS
nr:exportin-7-A isoform X1 [Ipomoea batatas]